MKRGRREAEGIALAMFAAVPLYFTAAIDTPSIMLFHAVMAVILAVELIRPGFETPRIMLRIAAIGYLFFYFFDSAILSRSLIRGTAHLLFFIAAYQSLDRSAGKRVTQRLLVTFLIAVASIATSTHITIVIFIVAFAILSYRQLISLSHEEAMSIVSLEDDDRPPGRAAAVYAIPMVLIAMLLFPLLPRVRDPFVRGLSGALQTSTGFSDSIDMSSARTITTDPRVIARVSMSPEARQRFTPIRLKGGVYDRYVDDRWLPTRSRQTSRRFIRKEDDSFLIAEPRASRASLSIQQTRTSRESQQLFMPVGTYRVTGVGDLYESRNIGSYYVPGRGKTLISFDADVSERIDPIRPEHDLPEYAVSDEIRALADEIAVNATTPRQNAAVIERYLATRYTYVSNAEARSPINAEKFLLDEKRGHCEHFAAGMVLLLAARGVPARIAGGYYGGELNPITGYYVIRQRDAHAWVEVWDGEGWSTYDPTPADLRPGTDVPNFLMTYLTAVGESINFFWDRYILTFGMGDQVEIFLRMFWGIRDALSSLRSNADHALSTGRLLLWSGIPALAAIVAALVLARARLNRTLFSRLTSSLRKAGIAVRPEMTTEEILAEVRRSKPQLTTPVRTVVECYRLERFSSDGATTELSGAARRALRTITEAAR